jgi:hypothetical protein
MNDEIAFAFGRVIAFSIMASIFVAGVSVGFAIGGPFGGIVVGLWLVWPRSV